MRIVRLALGLVPVPITLMFQLAFWTTIRPFGLFLFVQAIYISSWIGGLYAGLASTAASALIVIYFFVPPERNWMSHEPRHVLVLVLFVCLGIVISFFHERLRQANRALGRTKDEVSHLYEKTKELDELKTHLFTGVSHELRTPLTLVLGPAERLLAAPSMDAAVRRDVELIARNARTLLHYVDDLLEVTNLEARSVELQYAATDLVRLVRFAASHFEAAAKAKGVAYVVEAPEALWGEVDVPKVQRVLLNLLSNAVKFTPEGGRVRLTLREDETHERIVFEVADSGSGIPPDKREAVFNAYMQLESRSTRRFAGTGLGLTIARELVALHGGSIRIADAPEGGALVIIDLPRTAPAGTKVTPMRKTTPEAPLPETTSLVEETRGTTRAACFSGRADAPLVLVVEDNLDMNEVLCEVLGDDYQVATAFDGKEGLQKARALAPDVVVTDVMMPEMNGEELVRALRADPALASTPVIVLTAVADDPARVRLLREGARDYLTKPFRTEELLVRIESAVAQRRAEQEIHTLARMREEWSALIAHELRQPVGVIGLAADVARQARRMAAVDVEAKQLDRIQTANRRLTEMIDELLDVTRIESHQLSVTPVEIDVAGTAREVCERMANAAAGHPVSMHESAGPHVAWADPARVEQIISNLLSNAFKYGECNAEVRIDVESRNDEVEVTVTNRGRGIPSEEVPRLFHRFARSKASRTSHVPGIGLGLYICKGLVEAQGGRIWFESTPGETTSFHFTLPTRPSRTSLAVRAERDGRTSDSA